MKRMPWLLVPHPVFFEGLLFRFQFQREALLQEGVEQPPTGAEFIKERKKRI
jgi:hypothetical protein